MGINRARKISSRLRSEAGQTMLIVVLALSFFLLGIIAFAVDMAHVWYHRQTAQTAADAACTAGIMDMLIKANGGTPPSAGFTPGTAFSCSGSPTAAPCKYAAKNGYNASTLVAGKPGVDLNFSFPTSVSGLPACGTGKNAPPVCNASSFTTHPFMQVNVTDRVQTFFAGLLNGSRTLDVGAKATCALAFSSAPIPILVLNPTLPGTLSLSGTGSQDKITIYGGPQRSIQVNSSNSAAVSANGGPKVNLSQGGPNLSGSDIGVTGGPGAPPFTYIGSPPGQWVEPTGAISDPFATLPVPAKPATNGTTKSVPAGTNGCPGTSGTCTEYSAGYYASTILVKNGNAIFDPGLYYLDGSLTLDANSCVRPSTLAGDGSGGTLFYFHGTGTVTVKANSGSSCPASISTTTGTGTGQLQFGVKCTSSSEVPGNLPATITGNLLMGPCTGTYGDPLGTDDPIGEQHGIVFFQNRSVNLATATQPSWGGGGSSAILGTMYFHYCNSPDGTGLGSNCPSSAFTDNITLQGNPGSTSYVVGDIITDELGLGGTPSIFMDLNPSALFYVLKATLIQ